MRTLSLPVLLTGILLTRTAAIGGWDGGTGASRDTSLGADWSSLTVDADSDSALVYVDSVFRGTTPLSVSMLPPGRHTLRVLPKRPDDWFAQAVSDTVNLNPGEARLVRVHVTRWYSLISIPSGARAYFGDSLAGTTPLLLRRDPRLAGKPLRLEKEGYESATPELQDGDIFRVALRKSWKPESRELESRFDDLYSHDESHSFRLYLTGALTILSGAGAAYFKEKADNRHDLYLLTGDPALRAQTHRLDNASALFLVAAEAGFALFTYFLLSE